jgi:hypothetical protein
MIDELEALDRFRNDTAPPSEDAKDRALLALAEVISAEQAGRHRYPRRPKVLSVAVIGIAAAVIAITLAIAHPFSGPSGPGNALPGSLRKAILAAYDAQAGNILYVHQTFSEPSGDDYVSDRWSTLTATQAGQQVTTRVRLQQASGAPVQDFQFTYTLPSTTGRISPVGAVTDVDYLTQTWYHQSNGQMPLPPMDAPNYIVVGSLSNSIANLQWSDLGTTTLNGQPAIELSQVNPPDAQSFIVWVDPSTYLPIQEMLTYHTDDGNQAAEGSVTSTLGYLPPSSANLAELNVTVPAGFTQISGPS